VCLRVVYFFGLSCPSGDAREFAQVALRHGLAVLPEQSCRLQRITHAFSVFHFSGTPAILKSGVTRLATAWRDYESSDRRERPSELTLV